VRQAGRVSITTVVLCPPLPGAPAAYDVVGVADELLGSVSAVSAPDAPVPHPGDDERTVRAHWVAEVAMHLAVTGAQGPLLLVLAGSAGELAPAVGFSQRASRRAVAGYVLVDAATPPMDGGVVDWPDAPVTYLATPASDPLQVNQARLRGWVVTELGSATEVASAVAAVAADS
jgi:hypothetical protein